MSFIELLNSAPNEQSQLAFAKGCTYLQPYNMPIMCGISGGSDSDVLLDIIVKLCAHTQVDVRPVFFNTGIEMQATLNHINYLRERYNIQIEEVKARKPVPLACKQYGVPFLSKYVSDMISRLQRYDFKWEDESYEVLVERYPKCKGALRWWCNMNGESSSFNISANSKLKEFMIKNPPQFKISNKCCHYSKKLPSEEYCKSNDIKMVVLGIRKAEGGIRSTAYKSCYSDCRSSYNSWRPLFWFTDADKQEYVRHNRIVHSDCYKLYGLSRTGCAGCPFGRDFETELQVLKKYEPKVYKAVMNIFGDSYEYTRAYMKFKKRGGAVHKKLFSISSLQTS